MDVDRLKASAGEGGGHLDFAVDALFAENGDGRTGARDHRGGGGDIKGNDGRDAGVGAVAAQLVFGFGASGIVADRRDAPRDVGPDRAQGEEVFVEQDFAAAFDAEAVVAVERADARGAGLEAVLAERLGNVI